MTEFCISAEIADLLLYDLKLKNKVMIIQWIF